MLMITPARTAVPLVILLVTLLFLFPVQVGSFQATHGPTSTLKECLMGLLVGVLIMVVAQATQLAAPLSFLRVVRQKSARAFESLNEIPLSLRC